MDNFEVSPPLDLSHHYSDITKHRAPSAIKSFYKYFTIPGIGGLAGGLPSSSYFPFDTLEASTALSNRFKPTAVSSGSDVASHKEQSKLHTDRDAYLNNPTPAHLTVPHDSQLPDRLSRIDLSTALQYGTAQGFPPLANFVRDFALNHLNPNIPYKNGAEIILTCGSTDGFAKTIDCFTDPWSTTSGRPISERQGLLCEEFAYMNAIQTVAPRGLNIVPIVIDAEGMVAYGRQGCLYDILSKWDVERDGGRRPHIMYTVTMGQNPTSGLLSVKRRREIYEICQKFDVLIVEDDPYFYMQYPHVANELTQKWRDGNVASMNHFAEADTNYQTNLAVPVRGEVQSGDGQSYTTTRMRKGISSGSKFLDSLVPSYLSLDVDGRVIRLDTFSKTVAPGCRLGWVTAQPDVIDKLLRIAEVSTQQPSGFVQSMLAELLIGPDHMDTYKTMMKNKRKGEQPSEGWQMDGWIRWLEGLRGNYERRMRAMAEVLERGKTSVISKKPSSELSRTEVMKQREHIRRQWHRHWVMREDHIYASNSLSRFTHPIQPVITSKTIQDDFNRLKLESSNDDDFELLKTIQIYDFNFPMAGMFLWVHFNFDIHPLKHKFTYPELSQAFWVFQTRKPYLILTAPGTLFAPTEKIRQEKAWQYFRLSFAQTQEDQLGALTQRFVNASHDFWDVEDEDLIRDLLDDNADAMSEERIKEITEEGGLTWSPVMC